MVVQRSCFKVVAELRAELCFTTFSRSRHFIDLLVISRHFSEILKSPVDYSLHGLALVYSLYDLLIYDCVVVAGQCNDMLIVVGILIAYSGTQ